MHICKYVIGIDMFHVRIYRIIISQCTHSAVSCRLQLPDLFLLIGMLLGKPLEKFQ